MESEQVRESKREKDFVQFLSKHGLVAIRFDRVERLTPYCNGFK